MVHAEKEYKMSAYVVSDKHIDALLTFADRPRYQAPDYYYRGDKRVTFYDNLDAIGQALLNQNYASVNHRYQELNTPPEYRYTRFNRILSPVEAIKACDCYKYQACENEGHEKTEAWTIIEHIRERAIDELPGMDKAAWGIR
jgi:hypothetical protein